MLRRVLILVAALCVAVGGYLWVSSADPTASRGRAAQAPAPPPPLTTSTRPVLQIRGGDAVAGVGGGDRPEFNVIDPNTGRVRYRFSAESWSPVAETVFDVRKPDIRIFMSEGETTYITADVGKFEVSGTSRNDLDPKSGELTGNVRIVIDRATRAWREDPAHRDRLERDQHPEMLVTITMVEARFDIEAGRLTADGPVDVHAEEADVHANPGGDALTLTWNGIDNRIDSLELRFGGQMELRRDTGLVSVRMPGEAESATQPAGPPASEPPRETGRPAASRAVADAVLLSGDDVLAALRREMEAPQAAATAPVAVEDAHGLPPEIAARLSPDERAAAAAAIASGRLTEDQLREMARRRASIITYAATFRDRVHVEQLAAEPSEQPAPLASSTPRTGSLDCDTLELVFEVGKARSGLGVSSSQPTAAPAGEAGAMGVAPATRPANGVMVGAGPAADRAGDGRSGRITVAWAGPMELRPTGGAPPAQRTGRRFDVIATGAPVRMHDDQGEGVCRRLIYRNESRSAWLTGDADGPARLASAQGREMVAQEIALDRSAARARLAGAGRLRDPGRRAGWFNAQPAGDAFGLNVGEGGSDEPVDVQWSAGVEIDLAAAQQAVDTPQGPRFRTQDYLRAARFSGGVSMTQGRRSLRGELVAMTFGVPRRAGVMADHITWLDIRGSAYLADETRAIRAATLTADMMLTRDGRSAPRHVEAGGDVSVSEGDRRFESQRMTVDFAEAPLVAVARSGDARSTPSGRPGDSGARSIARRVVAEGRVFARDPQRRLELDADHFDAWFGDSGDVQSLVAVGPGDSGWAYTQSDDYAVNGHRVSINAAEHTVAVPDRGQAIFVTQRDFDGRPLDSAVTVSITFDAGMSLDGRRNIGEFNGAVHASTDTHDMTCRRKLTVRFEDLPPDNPTDAGVEAGRAMAQSRPRADGAMSFVSARPDNRGLAGVPEWMRLRWLGGGETAARDSRSGVAPRFRKRPTAVIAEGDAVALTTDADSGGRLLTRLRVSGPTLDVNLATNHMTIPGAGTLMIEDYRPPRSAHTSVSTYPGSRPPLAQEGGNGPSQTAFFWGGAMSYEVRDARVTFDRAVQMVHRSGGDMVLQGELAAALGADVERLRKLPARNVLLNCEHLMAQFVSQTRAGSGAASTAPPPRGASPLDARWTDLRSLDAQGAVLLREGARTLEGESLTFNGATNTIVLTGRSGLNAELLEQDEVTQRVRSWKGPIITWNRATGSINAPGAIVTVR